MLQSYQVWGRYQMTLDNELCILNKGRGNSQESFYINLVISVWDTKSMCFPEELGEILKGCFFLEDQGE